MKTLLILRHAKSNWNYPDLSDYDRPLNARGKQDAPRMGEHLREQGLIPDRSSLHQQSVQKKPRSE